MNGNTFGTLFRITTYGESHGSSVGAIVDGCPSGLPLSEIDFALDMGRRQGGKSSFTTARKETDEVLIESGVFEGLTTGAPISLRVLNRQQNSQDYEPYRNQPRPGHADLTLQLKQGHRDHRGGGRSSARETTARVAAGVVAKKVLAQLGVRITAWVNRVGPMPLTEERAHWARTCSVEDLMRARDASELGFPETEGNEALRAVEALKEAGDSWGGQIGARIDGAPPGLGEPIFDKLPALLSHGLFSLPAVVAVELGGGESMSHLPGSAIRDPIGFKDSSNQPTPLSNNHGGFLGGLSTGWPMQISVSFHAPTSIPRPIETVDLSTNESTTIEVVGRHDSFPLPRAIPMVEAMLAITLTDCFLRSGKIGERL
jgi:chorismate synthase